MATAAEIAAFRLLIDEGDDKLPYTDAALSDRLDGASSPQALAAVIWTEKAAALAALVDVSESGSSRSLGQLQNKALAMAKVFNAADPTAPGTGSAVRGVRMSRLTR
jgi:hypothetical protein